MTCSGVVSVARRRGNSSKRSGKKNPKSPNVVKEGTMILNGKPHAFRVYRKADGRYVATISTRPQMVTNKPPRLGKKLRKRRSR